jgi:hypothetical protein
MTPKEKQRELIVEIMKADEQSGLYDEPIRKNTAVDYLFKELWDRPKDKMVWFYIFEKAKQMEEGQIAVAYSTGTLEGVTQNFTNGYSYYEKTYKSK